MKAIPSRAPMPSSSWPAHTAMRVGTSWRHKLRNSVRVTAFITAAHNTLNSNYASFRGDYHRRENSMKLRKLSLACFALLLTVSGFAQSSSAPSDPLSGVWKGDMGPSETTRFPITMTLKFDGKSAFSGAITGPPRPGEIKTGTFDPKTGALTLEVEVR